MSTKSGTFGSAKPLPGQSGYNESQTAMLEREAQEMENRLKMLQERMQQQNEDDEKLKSKTMSGDGTRWKGASKKKGSVTSYAKDVQEKLKKQSMRDPSKKATAAARRTQRKLNESQYAFNNKDVEQWSVEDVGEWLSSMLLQQHVQSFANNAISGAILLEVSLEDLDYMDVTVLAHRKVILKGIEDLRRNKRVTKQLFAPAASIQSPKKQTMSSDDGNVGRVTPDKEEPILADKEKAKPKAHWSTLEPLHMKEVVNDENNCNKHMVNGADTTMGVLDEEAERRAFQEAVMAWRHGTCANEKGGKSILVNSEGNDSDQWTNPFGDAKKSNVTTGAGMDKNPEEMVIVSARSNRSEQDRSSENVQTLADGALDEEKERKAFQAAVEAWRSGNDKPVSKNKEIADKLAQQMDAMHEESAAKMKRDQDAMLSKIQKAREDLDKAKTNLEHNSVEIENYNDSDDVVVGYGSPPANYFGGDSLSPCSSVYEDDEREDKHHQSYLEVKLIESTALNMDENIAGEDYVVDEPSSDDE